jgi:sugar (pentulose or hexulose) kinase
MASFLGLDIGTQGARALVCEVPERGKVPEGGEVLGGGSVPERGEVPPGGQVVAQAVRPFPPEAIPPGLPPGYAEQLPAAWWQAAVACLRQVTAQVPPETIQALSITSTSGTLCLLDRDGEPLIPALMYNDARADDEAEEVQAAGSDLAARLGYRFNPSFALAKLLWLARHRPDMVDRASHIAHAADFLVGRLSGIYDISDYSNALKTGYDLSPQEGGTFADCWPDFIADKLNLPVDKLPRVVAPGEVIGTLTTQAAEVTGLRPGTLLVAGMTDGCAAQIAAGAVAPGDWNSTLGTTLVIKGVSERLLRDPEGRIYSHRHPDGYWLPGGASNVGGEILATRFPEADLATLDRRAEDLSPTDFVAYPLARRGERFPFVHSEAEDFVLPFPLVPGQLSAKAAPGRQEICRETLYAAYLEGVAYVERLAYETLESLGATVSDVIRAAGGGARSDVWLQIRADVLNRQLLRPVETGAAMGAAILAASRTHYDGVIPAARAMVKIERSVQPRPALVERYDERYQHFRAACAERGYLRCR